jgi:hypothetical protein
LAAAFWCRGAVVQSWKSPAFSFTSSLCDRSVAHSFGKTWLLADWVRRTSDKPSQVAPHSGRKRSRQKNSRTGIADKS